MVFFNIKIIDIVLLHTIFGGILLKEFFKLCNLVCFGVQLHFRRNLPHENIYYLYKSNRYCVAANLLGV